MGLIRYGDPSKFPDIDSVVVRGVKYKLDTVWRYRNEAESRKQQLEDGGGIVFIQWREAPPEEVQSHYINRGIPELGEKVHLDGSYTKVWDVWIAASRTYRKRSTSNPKSKRQSDDLTSGILNVTKAGVTGVVGMGVVGMLGGMLRKKHKSVKKVKRCRCKK